MNALKAVFFGTPEFSVDSLKVLHNHPNIDLAYVVTMPDRPAGRGKKLVSPPVAEYAKVSNIPLLQTANINKEEEFLEKLKKENIDFFLVIAFAQFLSQKVLDITRLGAFNIHTSLLPKYRGAAPIQYALLNGDQETGVSIQRMVKKMDAGDILFERGVTIDPLDNSKTLFNKLQTEASIALGDFLEKLLTDDLTPRTQDESLATFAPSIKKADGFINFKNLKFDELNNRLRAYTPWPGLYFYLNTLRVKVHEIESGISSLEPGAVSVSNNALEVGLSNRSVRLKTIQLEGKKASSDTSVLSGLKNKYSEFHLTEEP